MSRRPNLFLALVASAVGLATAAATTSVACAQTNTGSYDALDPYRDAVQMLKSGISSTADGSQHAALVSLRQLRDPSLVPLFERLIRSDDWSVRVDSVLGLAELSPNGKVDIERIASLPGETDRDTAITAVLALKLADAEQVRSMLDWSDLPSTSRVLLAGELRRLGQSPDAALLNRLAKSKTPEVAGLATAILIDMKAKDSDVLAQTCVAQVAALPPASRGNAVAQIAEACSSDKLAGAGAFVASLLKLPEIPADSRMRAIGSLLVVSPVDAYAPLAEAVAADRSQVALVRYAVVLLASGARAPAEQWAQFRNGDAMLEAIADAGAAIAKGDNTLAFNQLVALERRVVLRAALDGARRLGPDAEKAFGVACLNFILKPGNVPDQLRESLMLAIFRLAEVAPNELKAALASNTVEESFKDQILLALLSSGTTEATAVARTAQGKTNRGGEGKIAVLVARNSDKVTPDELRTLWQVAGGATNLPAPIRTQAAWLWLKHSNKINEAIAELAPASAAGAKTTAGDAAP